MVRKITKWHVLIPFLRDYRRHVILADIEREIGFSHQIIKKHASELSISGILVEEKKPRNIIYSLNPDNPRTLDYISTAEKIALDELLERNILLKRLYEVISPYKSHASFLLFGSSASGRIGNDIDILVMGKAEMEGVIKFSDAIKRFEKSYGKKVHFIISESFPTDAAFIREIIKNHVIFAGFDSFTTLFWLFTWKR